MELFTDGWTVDGRPVRLPHDAMLGEPRSATGGTGSHGGYFPGGRYTYAKRWTAQRDHTLLFEGVHGQTTVLVDGVPVAECPSGYREFRAPLPAGDHLIEVRVDNTAVPNSRWYTGSGLYRPVWLDHPHLRDLRFHTVAPGEFEVTAGDDGRLEVELADAAGVVARADGPASGVRLTVPDARPWSHRDPHLYTATVRLRDGDTVRHQRRLRVGLRTVEVDPRRGLLINGEPVLLQGACVHHDNGLLGAATFRAAEFRRARLLKENGFTAIRSSHNPLSRDLLDACDELGLYVLDELTDVWFWPKTAHDLAPRFDEIWRDDARSMVAKDVNHPSVIMYSIGNEIGETATERGVATAREMHDFITGLDPHRPTTVAINLLLNMMASRGKSVFRTEEKERGSSTAANLVLDRLGGIMRLLSRLPLADRVSRDAFAQVDVAGYNYAWSRYAGDRKRHPERVILGTESLPGDLPEIWAAVRRVPGVIGDFMWTGWDYLGETGIGVWAYGDEDGSLAKPYPALVAGPGALDITGRPTASALLARAVWGVLPAPAIAVRPLDRAGRKPRRAVWRASDAVPSWAWRGCAGRPAEIEVYTTDDEVELFLNGRSLGRRRPRRFVARWTVPYQPGELTAVGRSGTSVLRSAGPARLRLTAEPGDDLTFVHIELADDGGTVEMLARDTVTVAGDGLVALGSAAPATEESFTGDTHTTYYGRALAVLRPGAYTVTSRRHGSATITVP